MNESLYATKDYTLTVGDGYRDYVGELYIITNTNTGVAEHGTYSYPSAIESIFQLQDHHDMVDAELKARADGDYIPAKPLDN